MTVTSKLFTPDSKLNVSMKLAALTRIISVSNSLTITSLFGRLQSIEQPLIISQNVSSVNNINKSISQVLTVSQLLGGIPDNRTSKLGLTKSKFLNFILAGANSNELQNILSISQSVVPLRIRFQSKSQSLTLTQSVTESLIHNATTALTINQTVSVEVQRFSTLSSTLAITHSVVANVNFNIDVSNTLVFGNTHQIPDGTGHFINVPNLLFARGGSAGNPCCITGTATTVFVTPTRSITLPNPEFGDGQSLVAAVKIIRTITGGTYSYVKKSANRKLKYKFQVTQRKAFELRQFLLDFIATRLMLYTWKAEIWSGFILTDPSEIISIMHGDPCIGDLFECEIDFQGIKVN